MVLKISRFEPRPHPINGVVSGLFLFSILTGFPCPHMQKAEQIAPVYLGHFPPAVYERVVRRVDESRQRQTVVSVCAAFVGNSVSTFVALVCTAMSASAMSCTSLSAGYLS